MVVGFNMAKMAATFRDCNSGDQHPGLMAEYDMCASAGACRILWRPSQQMAGMPLSLVKAHPT